MCKKLLTVSVKKSLPAHAKKCLPWDEGTRYQSYTMLELAEKVISLAGSDSKIVFKPLPQDDPMQRQPVIDLARKELSWEPTVDLDEGLIRTIEYFRVKLGIY